jgi:hypothetical protein
MTLTTLLVQCQPVQERNMEQLRSWSGSRMPGHAWKSKTLVTCSQIQLMKQIYLWTISFLGFPEFPVYWNFPGAVVLERMWNNHTRFRGLMVTLSHQLHQERSVLLLLYPLISLEALTNLMNAVLCAAHRQLPALRIKWGLNLCKLTTVSVTLQLLRKKVETLVCWSQDPGGWRGHTWDSNEGFHLWVTHVTQANTEDQGASNYMH